MKRSKKNIITLLIALAAYIASPAQVSVKALIDKNKILIGEPIALTVDAYTPVGVTVEWFDTALLAPFEIIQQSNLDTVQNIDNKQTLQKFTITAFDSGRLVIPPIEVKVNGTSYFSDSLVIHSSFASFDPQEDYRDIKDIINVKEKNTAWIMWAAIIILAILLYVLIRVLKKQKEAASMNQPVVPVISPYEEAMQSLKELEQKGSADLGEKMYYTVMNNILRKYVAVKFHISTVERTNYELVIALSAFNIPGEAYRKLTHSLRIADYVKFAKFRPTEDDNHLHLDTVRQSIIILDNAVKSAV